MLSIYNYQCKEALYDFRKQLIIHKLLYPYKIN